MISAASRPILSLGPGENPSTFTQSSSTPAAPPSEVHLADGRVEPSQCLSNGGQDISPASQNLSMSDSNGQLDRSTPLRPPRRVGASPCAAMSIKAIIFASRLNVLLIFVPLSWAMHFTEKNILIVFIFSFVAMIPLAKLFGFATDELVMRFSETKAGLLHLTLENMVEFVVAMVALMTNKLDVVKSSLMGAILSKILLVLGMCFFAGGIKFSEQGFLATTANTSSTLLTLGVGAILTLTTFNFIENSNASPEWGKQILQMSHGVAIILLFAYITSLVFQLWTHANLLDQKASDTGFHSTRYSTRYMRRDEDAVLSQDAVEEDEAILYEPRLSVSATIVLLTVVTMFVAITAVGFVNSIDVVTERGKIKRQWVTFILIPILGAATHIHEAKEACVDRVTLCLTVSVGSSIQIALFVVPILTILAWILNKPLTLVFDPFECVMIFLAVMAVNYGIRDCKSNWFTGICLICLYSIIALTSWFPSNADRAQDSK